MDIISAIENRSDEHTSWRRHLHQRPETAFEEVETSRFVAEKLEAFGIEVFRGIGKTGVVGVLTGKTPDGPRIGLRADMDALEIQEQNDFGHCSDVPGKMHACGHDGHTTTLLAAAQHLAATREFNGTVVFIFQPAEEKGGGANAMIRDGLFEEHPVDKIFGIHNWPDAEVNTFLVREGPLLAANASLTLTVTGKGGHAAMPNLANDPILISAHIITALQGVVSRYTDPLDSAVVSITQVHGGEQAANAIPDRVVLGGSLRFLRMTTRDQVFDRIRSIVQGVCDAFGADFELELRDGYPVTDNHPDAVTHAVSAAVKTVGVERVVTDTPPIMGSEDFSYYLQHVPGCFVFLGSRVGDEVVACHNPRYDFNDAIIPVGATYFVNLVQDPLGGGDGA